MLSPSRLLFWLLAVSLCHHAVTVHEKEGRAPLLKEQTEASASRCLGGSDIFATVRENSPFGQFVAHLSVNGDHHGDHPNAVRMCLSGENADWLYLEDRSLRLNSSTGPLDREVLGSLLMAELKCYANDILQSRYRVMVEILNENDNTPNFLEETIEPFHISELTAVNAVVFRVKAVDADGDTITYIIDQSLPDSSYFRIDLPNSGDVVLDKPLDYETKTQLQLIIYAMETNTMERNNVTTAVTVNVLDGDDQYPRFVPCSPASTDVTLPVCTEPVYTANVTENLQDVVLEFSPGPIHAEDGDRSLDTRLTYTLLSGADGGIFSINNETGEITLTRRVEDDRGPTSTFRLRIMASQLNDPNKYSVTTALVNVLAENSFPPVFKQTVYKGFVLQNSSPATIVTTYRNQVLLIQAVDRDFRDGVNPRMHYSIQALGSSETGLYHITQEGVLIVRTDRLHAADRHHILQVVALDQDSGEVATASVEMELLQGSQAVPWGPFALEQQLFGGLDQRLVGGLAAVMLLLLVSGGLFLLLGALRRERDRPDAADRGGAVVLGQHHNVVDSSGPVYFMEELVSATQTRRHESLHGVGRQGVYTRKQSISISVTPPIDVHSDQKGDDSRLSSRSLSASTIPEPDGGQTTHAVTSIVNETHGVTSTINETYGVTSTINDSMLERESQETAMETEHIPGVKELTRPTTGVTVTGTDRGGRTQEDPHGTLHEVICEEDGSSTEVKGHEVICEEDSSTEVKGREVICEEDSSTEDAL